MSESKKKSKNAKNGNPVLDWVIRGAVFGVLGILLVLALMDFQAKQNATSAANAWLQAMKAKGEHNDLAKSELARIPIKGSPALSTFTSPVKSVHANTIDTYTWKGTFRSYSVKVSYGLGNDPSVEEIAGPGDAAKQ